MRPDQRSHQLEERLEQVHVHDLTDAGVHRDHGGEGRDQPGTAVVVVGLTVFATVGDPAAGLDNAPTADWISALLVIAVICIGLVMFGGRGGAGSKAAVFGDGRRALRRRRDADEARGRDGARRRVRRTARRLAAVGDGRGRAHRLLVPAGVTRCRQARRVRGDGLGRQPRGQRPARRARPPGEPGPDAAWHAVVAIGALAVAMLGAVIIASASEPDPHTVRLATA